MQNFDFFFLQVYCSAIYWFSEETAVNNNRQMGDIFSTNNINVVTYATNLRASVQLVNGPLY